MIVKKKLWSQETTIKLRSPKKKTLKQANHCHLCPPKPDPLPLFPVPSSAPHFQRSRFHSAMDGVDQKCRHEIRIISCRDRRLKNWGQGRGRGSSMMPASCQVADSRDQTNHDDIPQSTCYFQLTTVSNYLRPQPPTTSTRSLEKLEEVAKEEGVTAVEACGQRLR